jgi:hypothetical protein
MAQIILDSNSNLIQGDFDSATVNNRTKLQTSTTNATTGVYVVPNGSATSASVQVSNAADPTNASKVVVATNASTDTQIVSGANGSGSYLPLSFYTNNDIRFQMGNAGELNVRTAPGTVSSGTSGQVLTSGGSGAGVSWATVSGTPAGTIIQFAGTSAPTGYLLCPTSATTVSRTTYATLFAAIGTTWGAGDGSTTFNIPAFTADFAPVQASANVGTTTTGSVIAHSHSQSLGGANNATSNSTAGNNFSTASGTTGSTGGTNNLAAGARVLFCIKF